MLVVYTTLLLLLLTTVQGKGKPAPTVTTSSGRLRGRYMETRDGRLIQAFLGVPFAKPPVGPLRFEPPQPVEPWEHERLAVTHPPACAQPQDLASAEDCLYLNIFTLDSFHSYPVMVYIHGGSFEVGAAYGYTPEYFLDEDVVFVAVQYRLGLLGFLSTGDEVVSGNMGLKDIRLALRWLRDNVHNFGGDPQRITIYGQSAGAVAVHLLMTFAAHEGLFWAGISESGCGLLVRTVVPPTETKKMVPTLAALSGCPEDSEGLVECLRVKPQDEIVALYSLKYKGIMYGGIEVISTQFLPLIGAVLEPECVEDRLITGNPWDHNTTIPWMTGINSKETLFMLLAQMNDRTEASFTSLDLVFDQYFPLFLNYQNSIADGTLVPFNVRQFYLDFAPISRVTLSQTVDIFTDSYFTYEVYEALKRANKEHCYFYFFDYIGANQIFPVPPDSKIGVCHSDELFFFFPHPGTPLPDRQVYTDFQDDELSRKLVKMWANFATCLDPTPSDSYSVNWEPFFPNESFLHITQTDMFTDHQFLPERMNFWKNQPFPYRNDRFEPPPCRGE